MKGSFKISICLLVVILVITTKNAYCQGFASDIFTPEGESHATKDVFEVSPGKYVGLGIEIGLENNVYSLRLNVCGLDSVGNLKWLKGYGGDGSEDHITTASYRACFKTINAIYYAGTLRSSSHPYDYGTLMKFDFEGNLLWQKYFKEDTSLLVPYKCAPSVDGGILMAGYTAKLTTPAFQAVLLIKTDSQGKELWRKKFHKSVPDYAKAMAVIQDSASKNIILAGEQSLGTVQSHAPYDMIMSLDSLGNELYRGNRYIYAGICNDIIQTHDKKFVAVGYCDNQAFDPRYSSFAYKFDVDSPAKDIWSLDYFRGFQRYNSFSCVTELSDNSLLIAGWYDTLPGGERHSLNRMIKLDGATGKVAWHRFYNYHWLGDKKNKFYMSLNPTSDGGWVASLDPFSLPNNPLFYVKYDSTGCDNAFPNCVDPTVGIAESTFWKNIAVYPSPFYDLLHVNLPERGGGEILLQVYDLSGRLLLSQPAHAGDNSLDLSTMQAGTYLLKIVSDGRPAGIRKIIKQ